MMDRLEEIARQVGVSVSTVSRALADKPGVSDKRRAEIRAVAAAAGFAPNPHASQLRNGAGDGLTMIVPLRPVQITVLRQNAVLGRAEAAFGQVRVMAHGEAEPLDTTVRRALATQPRAIVVSNRHGVLRRETLEQVRRRGVALAVMDGNVPDIDAAQVDRAVGVMQATRLLLASGCRLPVFWTTATLAEPDQRLRGILAAYREAGLAFDPAQLISIRGSDFVAGHALGRRMLQERAVDGVFAYNDELAVGLLKALGEANLRAPEEVRVIGFDNLPFADFAASPLTSVAQPVDDIAAAVIELCLDRLATPGAPPQIRHFATNLVGRVSAPLTSQALRLHVFAPSTETAHAP